MRQVAIVLVAMVIGMSPALSRALKGMRFWNLTSETLSEVSLAPAGSQAFGANQCRNDKDGTVEFDEQVAVVGVAPGRYDVRTRDIRGKTCLAKGVEVKADEAFSIRDEDLTACAR